MEDAENKVNEEWLCKRYPAEFEKVMKLLNLSEIICRSRTLIVLKGAKCVIFLHL